MAGNQRDDDPGGLTSEGVRDGISECSGIKGQREQPNWLRPFAEASTPRTGLTEQRNWPKLKRKGFKGKNSKGKKETGEVA
jgi:hypothetical protein